MRPMRSLTAVACFALLALIAAGCSGDKRAEKVEKKSPRSDHEETARPAPDGGGGAPGMEDKEKGKAEFKMPGAGDLSEAREAKREEAHVGGVSPVAGAGKGPKSGILTAGSFDDNLDRAPYRSFLKQFGQASAVSNLPGR